MYVAILGKLAPIPDVEYLIHDQSARRARSSESERSATIRGQRGIVAYEATAMLVLGDKAPAFVQKEGRVTNGAAHRPAPHASLRDAPCDDADSVGRLDLRLCTWKLDVMVDIVGQAAHW